MLFNSQLFNSGLFDGGASIAPVYSTDLVVFDGFSLSDITNVLCQNLIDSAPTREVISGNVPRGHGMYVNGVYWRKKPIEVRGIVKAETKDALDSYLDTIRGRLQEEEQELVITRKDELGTVTSVRTYPATWVNPEETFASREGHHTTVCPFVARFDCHHPFGRSRDYSYTTITASSGTTNQTIVNSGTAPAEPVVILVFDSATSITVVNVKRLDVDGTTLEEIEYSGTIAAGDALVFDSEEKVVTKNGTGQDFTGAHLKLVPGSNLLRITVTGTSFSAVTTFKSKDSYL